MLTRHTDTPLHRRIMIVSILVLSCIATAGSQGLEDWYQRQRDVLKGINSDWSGSVSGDVNARLGGKARLRFYETGNGALKVDFNLADRGGQQRITVNGTIMCTEGSRTYPVIEGSDSGSPAFEAGNVGIAFHDRSATAPGGIEGRSDDIYMPRSGSLHVQRSDDTVSIRLDARMRSLIKAGKTAEIAIQAETQVQRSLDNEHLFDPSRCAADETFRIVRVEPGDFQENVILDRPEILIRFSEKVHPDSLDREDLVTVRTRTLPLHLQPNTSMPAYPPSPPGTVLTPERSPTIPASPVVPPDQALLTDSDETERVPGIIDLKSPDTLRFIPSRPLRGGVRYQIDVAHGRGGVRSHDLAVLEEPVPTLFTTMVDLEQVRLHLYQTSRDAPLLVRKPAMARVYLDWTEHPDIHPDWQVLDYNVDIRVTRPNDERPVFPLETVRMRRPDQFDDEDRRLAWDSVNLFGWSPRSRNIQMLRARIRPHAHWPRHKQLKPVTGDRPVEFAREQVDTLTVDSYIALAGDWRDPPSDMPAQRHMILAAFRNNNEFARQTLPVRRISGRYSGQVTLPSFYCSERLCGAEGDFQLFKTRLQHGKGNAEIAEENYRNLEFQAALFHDHVALHSNADIVVGYYPQSTITEGRGQGIEGNVPRPHQLRNIVLMPFAEKTIDWPLVAHEYGHVVGLPHVPYVEDEAVRAAQCGSLAGYLAPDEGIEGFRIAANGLEGWSKSSTTGNAQNAPTLKNLMFPCIYNRSAMWWILDSHYRQLVDSMPGLLRRQRTMRAASLMSPVASGRQVANAVLFAEPSQAADDGAGPRWVLLSGLTDGNHAALQPVVGLPGPAQTLSPEGSFTLRVESPDGRVLGERAIGPMEQADGNDLWYFSTALEVSERIGRVAFIRGERTLGELTGSQPSAAPRILSHRPGELLGDGDELRWAPVGNDPEQVRYSVRYSPSGRAPWRTLAALTDTTSLAIDGLALTPGDDPTLVVIAHGELEESITRLQVSVTMDLRPTFLHPMGEADLSEPVLIEAWFNTELVPGPFPESALRLLDESGNTVPVQLSLAPGGDSLLATPEAPLQPNRRYRVRLAPGLRSQDGRALRTASGWSFTTRAAPVEQQRPVRASVN